MTTDIISNSDRIENYFIEYPDLFTEFEKKHIKCYAETFSKFKLVPDTIREVYDELGIIPDESNIYIGFMKLLSELHDIKNKKILEIGGGVIPRLGKRISATLDTGKIVIYDPRLSLYEMSTSKMKLVKERFKITTGVGDTDLMIGLMPCEAADIIVESALQNNVDFVLALCEGGVHGDETDFYDSVEEWQDSLIRYAEREVGNRGMGKLKMKSLEDYGSPYPVIYNDRG